jgi:single-stranded DNA-specific DHH superfamily exonuclease
MDAKEKAKKFLKEINENDKIALVFHDDLDGMASGVLLFDFLKKKKCNDIKFYIYSIDTTNFSNFDFSDREKIILADLAPHFVSEGLKNLAKQKKKILYIDHHQVNPGIVLPSEVLEYRCLERGYIPASRMVYELVSEETPESEWLGIAGTIGDSGDAYKENEQIISDFLKKENISIGEYKNKVAFKIGSFLAYFKKDLRKAFDILKEIKDWRDVKKIEKYAEPVEKEIGRLVKEFETKKEILGDIIFYYFKPKFELKSTIATKLSFQNPGKIYCFAVPKGNKILLSMRCQSDSANLLDIYQLATKGLENAEFGGHKRAAGATILAKDLEKFKENLKKWKG